MSDLPDKLREAFQRKRYGAGGEYDPDFDLLDAAADEIDRLRAAIIQGVMESSREAERELVAAIIERCAKIADPWPGYWIDHSSTEAECAVVAVRTKIAAKIRAMAVSSTERWTAEEIAQARAIARERVTNTVEKMVNPRGEKHED